jgi:pimeloyl-ACP methyl ester carboxylesterase
MKRQIYPSLMLFVVVLMSLLLACGGGQATPIPPVPPPPPPLPSETPTAEAPVSPIATPASPLATPAPQEAAPPAPQTVVFSTEDGLRLVGTLYGAGRPAAVIMSHMFPTDQTSWTPLATLLAEHGYAALTFDFRGYGASGGDKRVAEIDRDLQAAVAFMRSQGAAKIVLVGASMGGTATLKVAAREQPAAVVVISAPDNFQGLSVSPEEVKAIAAPKLFIGSEDDGATKTTLAMFEQAAEPKEKQVYPGNGHGTFIFDTELGPDLSQRILDFIAANVPPE